MPNYIRNYLVIQSDDDLEEILKFISSEKHPIDFHNIIPRPYGIQLSSSDSWSNACYEFLNKENITVPSYSEGHFNIVLEEEERFLANMSMGILQYLNEKRHGYRTWYEWSRKNWGTKWNAMESLLYRSNIVQFDTAWSAPVPVILELSTMFPESTFILGYADEDYGHNLGILKIVAGEVESAWHGVNSSPLNVTFALLLDNPSMSKDEFVELLTEDDEDEVDVDVYLFAYGKLTKEFDLLKMLRQPDESNKFTLNQEI